MIHRIKKGSSVVLCKRREMYNSLHIQARSAHITIYLRGHTHRRKYTFTQRSYVWRRQWSLFVRFTGSQLPVAQLEQLPDLLMSCWCLLSSTEKAEWTWATQPSQTQPLPVSTTWRTAYTTSENARMATHTERARSALDFLCQCATQFGEEENQFHWINQSKGFMKFLSSGVGLFLTNT